MNADNIKESAHEILKGSIETYLSKKKEPKSSHLVLDRIFPVERRIRSIVGGLETSLGTTFWQKLAIRLAEQNGFQILSPKTFEMPHPISPALAAIMSNWTNLREIAGSNIDLNDYINDLRAHIPTVSPNGIKYKKLTKGKGVDLWILRDEIEYAFDIKTVQMNAGDGNKFNSTLMNWYAYRLYKNPDIQLESRIIIPYSPFPPHTVESWWKKMRGIAYPLLPQKDIWVQDEFWDFITGTPKTWQSILQVVDELANSEFAKQFNDLFYPKKR